MQHRHRAIWIFVVLTCGFTLISFNLIQIQLVDYGKYLQLAKANHIHTESIPPKRGVVLDADGNILAQTQRHYDIRLDGLTLQTHQPEITLPKIADVLGLSRASVLAAYNHDPHNRYLLLAREVGDDVVAKLNALKVDDRLGAQPHDTHYYPNNEVADCLVEEPHDRRFYPNNELAAQVLGFVDDTGHGLAGMEKEMDKVLTGVPGERQIERDGKKHEIAAYDLHETPAVNGCNVTLTLRMSIQHVVENELDRIAQTYRPQAAYIIVMDPQTGEIMAMGSRPSYDPNDRKTFTPDNIKEKCLTDSVEPGSVFKIVPLAAALNMGSVNLQTQIFCENGSWEYGGKTLRDDEPNGWLSVREVLAKSSNIGFAKIALTYLHEQNLFNYASNFGFGHYTGLFTHQGETAGILRPLNEWRPFSITRVPMGQEVSVTPIQLTTAMCAIANGGRLLVPQLAKQVTEASGRVVQVYRPRVVRQVITADAARDVALALRQVAIDGTGKAIHIVDSNGQEWSFAAKTGTAQKIVNHEYSHTQHVASFLGFVPAEDPAFVALVMVDDPKTAPSADYGAQVSGPVFASLAKQVAQILNIPPDLPARTQLPVLGTTSNPATP